MGLYSSPLQLETFFFMLCLCWHCRYGICSSCTIRLLGFSTVPFLLVRNPTFPLQAKIPFFQGYIEMNSMWSISVTKDRRSPKYIILYVVYFCSERPLLSKTRKVGGNSFSRFNDLNQIFTVSFWINAFKSWSLCDTEWKKKFSFIADISHCWF